MHEISRPDRRRDRLRPLLARPSLGLAGALALVFVLRPGLLVALAAGLRLALVDLEPTAAPHFGRRRRHPDLEHAVTERRDRVVCDHPFRQRDRAMEFPVRDLADDEIAAPPL